MDNERYRILVEDSSNTEVIAAILAGLNQHAEAKGFTYNSLPLTISLRDKEDKIVAGLHGDTVYGWLYISLLWVSLEVRGQGYGKRLIAIAEKAAITRGCNNAYLNTFSFQALNFYQAIGYEIFAELNDFPEGQKRYFLRKTNLKSDDHA